MRPLVVPALLLVAACGPKPLPPAMGGTAEFRFQISDSAKNSMALVDPLVGTVYGNVFLEEDVSITGPRSGAMEFNFVEATGVDIRTGVSDKTFVTGTLAKGRYVFLGFFDVDGNGSASRDPDPGDPATLALTNKFEITDGNQTKRLVLFELIYN